MKILFIILGALIHSVIFIFFLYIFYTYCEDIEWIAFILMNEVTQLPFGLEYWSWIGDKEWKG